MPGPPPKDPKAKRNRRVTAGFHQLPYEGREGDPPDWPLVSQFKDEEVVWAQVWSTPQAAEWERLGWVRTVARYVRVLVEAEMPGASPALRVEARQLEDRLGLSPMAMLKLRWETDEPVEEVEPEVTAPIAIRSYVPKRAGA